MQSPCRVCGLADQSRIMRAAGCHTLLRTVLNPSTTPCGKNISATLLRRATIVLGRGQPYRLHARALACGRLRAGTPSARETPGRCARNRTRAEPMHESSSQSDSWWLEHFWLRVSSIRASWIGCRRYSEGDWRAQWHTSPSILWQLAFIHHKTKYRK